MTFKIKDGIAVGTANVFNSSGQLTTPQIKDAGSAFAVSLTPATLTAARTYTLPDKSGTLAMTSDLGGGVNDGTLTQTTPSAGATSTAVDLSFSTTYSANTATNTTIKAVVGPALSALATTMTGATTGFLKKTGADTYSLDTSTYLTSASAVTSISFGTTGLTPSTASTGAVTVAGTLALANGGTGATSAQAAINALAGAVTSGQYLRGNGTNVVMSAIQAADVPTLNQNTTGNATTATTATNVAGGAAGSVHYQTAAGTTAMLAAGTTSQVLISGTSPSWTNTPTLTGTNFTGIPNSGLTNSTISGVALGSNLFALTAGAALSWSTGTTYNGSAAATLAIDSTAAGTPSAWASVTTGSISIGAGITTGTVNIAASGTGASTINLGNTNSSIVVNGNLTVNGTTTTMNSTTLTVDDKNIELGSVAAPDNTTANGGGITLRGTTDKTIIWDSANSNWTSSEDWNVPTGKGFKINNVAVLSGTTLGSTIVSSSLTSVGTITSGTWSGSFGAVSGANLTSLTAGNLTGTIPSAVLGNSTHYVGTTAIALNRASANQQLTGILSTVFAGSTSGTTTLIPAAAAGTTTITMPATTGTMALTSDIPTVNSGTLALTIGTAGASSTSVTIGTGTGFNANSSGATTYDIKVGPALSALATFMNTATAGFIKRTGQDTFAIDTNTYLTAYTDTLATVTGRGATTATAVTFTNTTDSTSLSTGAVQVSGGLAVAKNLVVGGAIINTTSGGVTISANDNAQATVATVVATPIDTWAVATYRSAKYVVQITQGSNYQVSELLVIHNGTTTSMTEYAVLETNGSLATFTSDVSGGNARLIVTMGSATSATINIEKRSIVI